MILRKSSNVAHICQQHVVSSLLTLQAFKHRALCIRISSTKRDHVQARLLFTRQDLLSAQIDGLADLRSAKQHDNNMPHSNEGVNTPAPPLPCQSPLSFPSTIAVLL